MKNYRQLIEKGYEGIALLRNDYECGTIIIYYFGEDDVYVIANWLCGEVDIEYIFRKGVEI